MKNKRLRIFIIILVFVTAFSTPVLATNDDIVSRAQSLAHGVTVYKLQQAGADDVQAWIDGQLTEEAGRASEWYIIALSRQEGYDFHKYEEALLKYLSENDVASASTRQKYALALICTGSQDPYIQNTVNESIGKQGIMSLAYGLMLLERGYSCPTKTIDSVISDILSMTRQDGGWSITGQYGDVDVTAMTVQALAPYYGENAQVAAAIDRALEFLSTKQLDNGGFASYGVNNPESGAQVLMALTSLGIDGLTDSRFVKNNKTIIDNIETFRLEDGSFCHLAGSTSNENATVQVFMAMMSYAQSKGADTGNIPTPGPTGAQSAKPTQTPTICPTHDAGDSSNTADSSYKLTACIVAVAAGLVVCVILFVIKKRNIKNFIAVLVAVLVAVCIICVTDFKCADEYYNETQPPKTDTIGTVTMTIRCDTIVDKSQDSHIPRDGIILEETEFAIEAGDSVYDILVEATKKYKIQMENNGTKQAAYIAGINYIYEHDFGDLSGWVFFVNGQSPSIGCSEYILQAGDSISWQYSCELGRDLEQEVEN